VLLLVSQAAIEAEAEITSSARPEQPPRELRRRAPGQRASNSVQKLGKRDTTAEILAECAVAGFCAKGKLRESMSGHTPGKWVAMKPSKVGKHWSVCAEGRFGGTSSLAGAKCHWIVCRVHNGAPGDTLVTEEANARLIASAPDLYEALKKARDWVAMYLNIPGQEPAAQSMTRVIDAALAKVEGKS
jgi:hypothetical protein